MIASHQRIGRYVLPDPQASSDDARRLTGHDVAGLTDRELFAESVRVSAALAEAIATGSRVWLEWDRKPYAIHVVDWLEHRLTLIQAETRRRKGSRR